MKYNVKEINFHITDYCNGNCPYCYYTKEGVERKHGDLEVLKQVVHNSIVAGEVERFIMVGGDPCEYPYLVELLKYIKEEGKKYNVKTTTIVLSNTHDYKENGKPVEIKDIMDLVDEMDVTIHGSTALEHDTFNGVPGSYEHVLANIKKFQELKNDEQAIGVVVNVVPYTVSHFEEILLSTAQKLNWDFDAFVIQRIAPAGRAEGEVKWFIEKQDVNAIMQILHKMIQEKNKIVEFCDVLPWCTVKEEYRYMLPEGGCNWGKEVCAVEMDGSVKRCAMSSLRLTSKLTELDTKEKWERFWYTDPELTAFRKKTHLDEKCKACELLEKCGGSCAMARQSGDPYSAHIINPIDPKTGRIRPEYLSTNIPDPVEGHDYLRSK